MSTRIGIVHPGQMGASVARAAASAGASVGWASAGRSPATHSRADDAGLRDFGTLDALAEASDVLISVCPPGEAVAVARDVAGVGFGGVYVDANAIAPRTARAIAEVVTAAGARFVDGGIVGLPPTRPGTTRLYLCGADAETVAGSFSGSLLEAVVIDGGPGVASALKVCYAAWTKGTSALLMSVRALAAAEGVEDALLAEWALSQEGLADRSERVAANNAFKAWRFAGEMCEIAAAFDDAGLPDGFHAAAADLYERLADFKDRDPPPDVAEIVPALLAGGATAED